jgi:hypothetical protein
MKTMVARKKGEKLRPYSSKGVRVPPSCVTVVGAASSCMHDEWFQVVVERIL